MSDKAQDRRDNEGGGKGCLAGLLTFILVSFVIGFLIVFFGLGTERGRNIVQDWLEKKLSMDLTIERVGICGALELVIENIVSKETDDAGVPVFKVKEMKLGLRQDGTCCISAYKAALNLSPGKTGGWTPHAFGKLGSIPRNHMGDLSKITGGFRKRISIHVADSSISWIDNDGVAMASVSGLSFDMKPLELPDRDIYFYQLEAYNVLGADKTNIHNVKREWLASDAVDYIAVDRLSPQAIVPAGGFWEIK